MLSVINHHYTMSQDSIGCSLRQIRNEVSTSVKPTLDDKNCDNRNLGPNRRFYDPNQRPSVKDRLGPVPKRGRGEYRILIKIWI